MIGAKLKRRPVIVTYCNEIVGQGPFSVIASFYRGIFLRLLLARADRVVLISDDGRRLDRLRAMLPDPDRIMLVPPGVDTERFVPIPGVRESQRVFFLSLLDEFHRYKGLDGLLRGMVAVCSDVPAVTLEIGGEGPLRSTYEAAAKDLGVSRCVRFLGFIPDGDLVATYNRASVFVLPSTDPRQEGFGMVLAEAMACGVPVVTTSAVGMATAIREAEAGFVVPPGDTQELARCIGALLRDQDLAARMGMNGRALVQARFSSKSVSEAYERIYMDCLRR